MSESKKAFKPQIIRKVSMPTMKLLAGVPLFVKITEKIIDGLTALEVGAALGSVVDEAAARPQLAARREERAGTR